MRRIIQKLLYRVVGFLELCVSIMIIVVIAFMCLKLVPMTEKMMEKESLESAWNDFLSYCLMLTIGMELVRMLVSHSLGIVIEVLVFAVARQIIISHTTILETLIGIVAIAVLYASRKYLLIRDDMTEKTIYSAYQKVHWINFLEGMHMHTTKKTETIGEYMVRKLEEKGEIITVGASVVRKDCILKVADQTNCQPVKIELIKNLNG